MGRGLQPITGAGNPTVQAWSCLPCMACMACIASPAIEAIFSTNHI